jgi:hypothetical protein
MPRLHTASVSLVFTTLFIPGFKKMVEEEGSSPKQMFNDGKTGTSFPIARVTFDYGFIKYISSHVKSTLLKLVISFI